MQGSLVRRLFDGPVDIVGDVHGEIVALTRLVLDRLGYDRDGRHPEGRRLVFVGDLGDRGEDSPAVVEWVRDRVLDGRAQAVLGNHDFNAVRAAEGGPMKPELSWLFDEARPFHHHGRLVPQANVRGRRRDEVLAFFRTLPVALERDGELPLRVVHACWDGPSVERCRAFSDISALYKSEADRVRREIRRFGIHERLEVRLAEQNRNAVKRITSGEEGRSQTPIPVNSEPRWELRLPWWRDYAEEPLVVMGHYWRVSLPEENAYESLFHGVPPNAPHGRRPTMCVDFSVGKRFKERLRSGFDGTFRTSLAALRLPERVLYFDNAEPLPLVDAAP
jgi:hypothetical protein